MLLHREHMVNMVKIGLFYTELFCLTLHGEHLEHKERSPLLIVGEVRGAETIDMLQAMNTGHDGSLSTGHGNSIPDMLDRLETMVLLGTDIPLTAARKQIASAIDIMVHLGRLRDGRRCVLEVSEILGCRDGEIEKNPLFVFQEEEESVGVLKRTGSVFVQQTKLKRAGKKEWI